LDYAYLQYIPRKMRAQITQANPQFPWPWAGELTSFL